MLSGAGQAITTKNEQLCVDCGGSGHARTLERQDVPSGTDQATMTSDPAPCENCKQSDVEASHRRSLAKMQSEIDRLNEEREVWSKERTLAINSLDEAIMTHSDGIHAGAGINLGPTINRLKIILKSMTEERAQANVALEEQRATHEQTVSVYQDAIQSSKAEAKHLRAEISHLTKQLFETGSVIRVVVRLRRNVEGKTQSCINSFPSPIPGKHRLILKGGGDNATEEKAYDFDAVHPETDDNAAVSASVSPMIQAALDGSDVAIFLEGPSGSGKSHTLFKSDGIVPSMIEQFFPSLRHGQDGLKVELFAFEIYKEKTLNLLRSRKLDHSQSLKDDVYVRTARNERTSFWEPSNRNQRFKGCMISSAQEMHSAFSQICRSREQGESAQNKTSSRGHAICTINIMEPGNQTPPVLRSSLQIVDLAGAESLENQSPDSDETVSIIATRAVMMSSFKRLAKVHHKQPGTMRETNMNALRGQLATSPVRKHSQIQTHQF